MTLLRSLVLAGSLALSGCFVDAPNVESDGSTGTTAADGSSSGGESVCPEYCNLVQDVCTADFAQYTSDAICLAVCEAMPPGNPEDQLGNSAACRRFQAVQASENPAGFCGAAGPTGQDVCGARCESFCSLAMTLCTGEHEQWPDVPTCLLDCMQFPEETMFNASMTMGDSYACRMYHLTVASLDPDVHCPHIGLASPVCV